MCLLTSCSRIVLIVIVTQEINSDFMEPEGPLLYSQKPVIVQSALICFREQTTPCPVLVQQQWMLQCSTHREVKVMT
jgi:hypothetical protein